MVGTLVGYTDPNLMHGDESHIAFSPFTMVFEQLPRVGYYTANIMNAVILSSVLSCGNSSMYVASRMLYAMSHSSKAPRLFSKLNRRGVPVAALCATGMVSALAFFSTLVGDQKIYQLFYKRLGPERLPDLAGHRDLPPAFPQGLGRTGPQPG